jgi:hypothetical protein
VEEVPQIRSLIALSFSPNKASLTHRFICFKLKKGKMEGGSCVDDGMSLSRALLWPMLLIVLHDVLLDLALALR